MKYEFKTNVKKTEYDEFVKKASTLSFMQEYNWAFVKEEWNHFHCGLYKDKKLYHPITDKEKVFILRTSSEHPS